VFPPIFLFYFCLIKSDTVFLKSSRIKRHGHYILGPHDYGTNSLPWIFLIIVTGCFFLITMRVWVGAYTNNDTPGAMLKGVWPSIPTHCSQKRALRLTRARARAREQWSLFPKPYSFLLIPQLKLWLFLFFASG